MHVFYFVRAELFHGIIVALIPIAYAYRDTSIQPYFLSGLRSYVEHPCIALLYRIPMGNFYCVLCPKHQHALSGNNLLQLSGLGTRGCLRQKKVSPMVASFYKGCQPCEKLFELLAYKKVCNPCGETGFYSPDVSGLSATHQPRFIWVRLYCIPLGNFNCVVFRET